MSGQLSGHNGVMHHVCASFFGICLNTKRLLVFKYRKKLDNQLVTPVSVNLYESAGSRNPISKNLTSGSQKFSSWLKPLMLLLQSFTLGLKACYTLFLYKFKVCLSVPDGGLFQHGAILCAFSTCRSFAYFHFSCDRFFSRTIPMTPITDVCRNNPISHRKCKNG